MCVFIGIKLVMDKSAVTKLGKTLVVPKALDLQGQSVLEESKSESRGLYGWRINT